MGNCLTISSSSTLHVSEKKQSLPIETMFKLPSPLPSWPQGAGFATGNINLGGLQVCQISTFTKIWSTSEGGPDNLGTTFYEPAPLPNGFFILGSYAQPNNAPLFGWILVGKDDGTESPSTLQMPLDYKLVWTEDGSGYIWLPIPPDGYKPVGHIVTNSAVKPPLDKIRCVRSDLTEDTRQDELILTSKSGINIYRMKPAIIGTQALGVCVGTFIVDGESSSSTLALSCLKNKANNLSSMPNLNQIQALIQTYSPWIYFHPDEQYLPSSVNWFFTNGALLYKKGDESNPVPVDATGSNLPQGGQNDSMYWLDLPTDQKGKERVKKGEISSSEAYYHVKTMLGGTFTDIAIWVFYPFNGAARAKVEFVDVSLGKIGEHVGDWEHVTLRISNLTGELWRVFFSEHSGGTWMDASQLEFQGGNKIVTYASLHGHASYSKAGLILQGNTKMGVGIRNDAAKSKNVMDTGIRYEVVSADYLGNAVVVVPAWLNFCRKWGPKIDYDLDSELNKIEKILPGKLKSQFDEIVKGIPHEVLGEEGPTGPKMKNNWSGDESPSSGCFIVFSVMGSRLTLSSSTNLSKKTQTLPIETVFKFPTTSSSWPQGTGFATGIINLGGLEVCQVSTFNKIWSTHEGGADNLGATFFEPAPLPHGFFMLGCYSQPNNTPLFGWVLVGKDDGTESPSTLEMPVDYKLVWANDGSGCIWLPIPPDGYKPVGHMVTSSMEKPPVEMMRCVRSDLTEETRHDKLIWSNKGGIDIYGMKPAIISTQALGVCVGTFIVDAGSSSSTLPLSCLKNKANNLSCMPNLSQIQALIQTYSPWIHFHPDEQYFPSSVHWFFTNGALLYKRGDESNPVPVDANGLNLPQGSQNDGTYWLDLPINGKDRERVKKGDLSSSSAYYHVKTILGGTFTDIMIWVFYPFNGAGRAKVKFLNVPLSKIGGHVGDWEHVTLRISNFTGELWRAFFSQHSGGTWIDASQLEFQGGNKIVAYASLCGHAFYSRAGLVLQGNTNRGIGIRNDAAKCENVMDTGVRYEVVSAEHLGNGVIVEPAWLNFGWKWGPKIDYGLNAKLDKFGKVLPGRLKSQFKQKAKCLPNEVFGEEGPTGPKMKKNWTEDEV